MLALRRTTHRRSRRAWAFFMLCDDLATDLRSASASLPASGIEHGHAVAIKGEVMRRFASEIAQLRALEETNGVVQPHTAEHHHADQYKP